MFASGVPLTREAIDALVALGVRTVVSFTIMPLEAPRAMHVNLADFHNPGFADRDPDMLDGLFAKYNCTGIHMPCNDAGTFSTKQVEELVEICANTRKKDEAVLLHCWAGSRRTWAAARTAKRVLDKISADQIFSTVCGRGARSNQLVDKFLKSANFPAAPSKVDERLQLLALAAALQAVSGGNGLYSASDTRRDDCTPCMFTTYWPSTTLHLHEGQDEKKLDDAMKEFETTFGISKSASCDFPRALHNGWKDFADSVLFRACSDDKELASSITKELVQRGPQDIRDNINYFQGSSGFLQDTF